MRSNGPWWEAGRTGLLRSEDVFWQGLATQDCLPAGPFFGQQDRVFPTTGPERLLAGGPNRWVSLASATMTLVEKGLPGGPNRWSSLALRVGLSRPGITRAKRLVASWLGPAQGCGRPRALRTVGEPSCQRAPRRRAEAGRPGGAGTAPRKIVEFRPVDYNAKNMSLRQEQGLCPAREPGKPGLARARSRAEASTEKGDTLVFRRSGMPSRGAAPRPVARTATVSSARSYRSSAAACVRCRSVGDERASNRGLSRMALP